MKICYFRRAVLVFGNKRTSQLSLYHGADTAAAKLLQLVVSDYVRPHRRQPTSLPCPWDSPGKNTGVGAIAFSWAGQQLQPIKRHRRALPGGHNFEASTLGETERGGERD